MKKFIPLIISACVIAWISHCLMGNYAAYFDEACNEIRTRKAVVLEPGFNTGTLASILTDNGYASSPAEAAFISNALGEKVAENGAPGNLNELRKLIWQVPAVARDGCTGLNHRVALTLDRLGEGYVSADDYPEYLPGNGKLAIRAKITPDKRYPGDNPRVDSIPVRISCHITAGGERIDSVMGYALTDSRGKARFEGLSDTAYYSVLPIEPGYDFGTAKGTAYKPLGNTDGLRWRVLKLDFDRRKAMTRLFADSDLERIRADKHVLVRTPQQFKKSLEANLLVIIALFFAVGFMVVRRNKGASLWLLAVLMTICGISVVNQYSLVDPLVDTLLGARNARGVEVGLLIICALVNVDPVKFYRNGYKLKFDMLKPKNWPSGTNYLLMALALTALLLVVGSDINGMKVNLDVFGLSVQPSEVAKFLMVVFMAAFFADNAWLIIDYSKQSKSAAYMLGQKIRLMLAFVAGGLALLALYFILSDMGPALVIIITFVLYYSMVKSTADINDDDVAKLKLRKIVRSDIFLLIVGVASFLLCVYAGRCLDLGLIAPLAWFVAWIGGFYMFKRRIQESAVMMCLVITIFIYGGSMLSVISETSGERFDARMAMCTNTWGDLGLEGGTVEPTSNSQVANGLWALASGGISGQGLGQGMTSAIPVFNTDMVMTSYGENAGYAGVVFLLALYCLLIWLTLGVGKASRTLFTFYLCQGIAIVTAVQLLVIVLGSVGCIPLTGVTVPLMSHGMTSIIMNMAAFGIVLAVQAHNPAHKLGEKAGKLKKKYKYPLATISIAGAAVFVGLAGVFFYYMVGNSKDIVSRHVFARNSSGRAVVEYNPRLLAIADGLEMGDVYDRRGVLVATSDKAKLGEYAPVYKACNLRPDTTGRQKRYYPFGPHMLFMLGDYNTPGFFSYYEADPMGYMAEVQNLSELRGYDNHYRVDENGHHVTDPLGGTPVGKVEVNSKGVRTQPFMPRHNDSYQTILRDYSSLVEGADKLEKKDLRLTVDAELQTRIQNYMTQYVDRNFADKPAVRVSAVILDARNGDLLASANYPLPDKQRIEAERLAGNTYYSDNSKPGNWKAYTDRDLGLTYQTAPGSTAKVITAMAGYNGIDATQGLLENKTYYVYPEEIIERSNGRADRSNEPNGKNVTLDEALVLSSNCYFINLMNDLDLYDELGAIYDQAGLGITSSGYGNPGRPAYVLDYAQRTPTAKAQFDAFMADRGGEGVRAYNKYIGQRSRKDESTRRIMNRPYIWGLAWGQGGRSGALVASPLNMARIISAVDNGGLMPHTRYLLDSQKASERLMNSANADSLKAHLHNQAAHIGNDGRARMVSYKFTTEPEDTRFGGKTGTPERERITSSGSTRPNDAWYVFYIDQAGVPIYDPKLKKPRYERSSLAVAVRIERTGDGMSDRAMDLAGSAIIKALRDTGYID